MSNEQISIGRRAVSYRGTVNIMGSAVHSEIKIKIRKSYRFYAL